jgi:hypothetical protein
MAVLALISTLVSAVFILHPSHFFVFRYRWLGFWSFPRGRLKKSPGTSGDLFMYLSEAPEYLSEAPE